MSDTAYHSETLAETIHALRDSRHVPMFAMKRQANRLMAGVLAVAVLAASALPSHADKRGDDLAKIIVGALVLGAVVNAIDNNKHHGGKQTDEAPQQHKPHKPKPQPGGLPVVPSVCAIEIESSDGEPVRMYGEKCLLERGFDYRLPDCAHDVKVYGQKDRIYSAKCLRDAGFKLGH